MKLQPKTILEDQSDNCLLDSYFLLRVLVLFITGRKKHTSHSWKCLSGNHGKNWSCTRAMKEKQGLLIDHLLVNQPKASPKTFQKQGSSLDSTSTKMVQHNPLLALLNSTTVQVLPVSGSTYSGQWSVDLQWVFIQTFLNLMLIWPFLGFYWSPMMNGTHRSDSASYCLRRHTRCSIWSQSRL